MAVNQYAMIPILQSIEGIGFQPCSSMFSLVVLLGKQKRHRYLDLSLITRRKRQGAILIPVA